MDGPVGHGSRGVLVVRTKTELNTPETWFDEFTTNGNFPGITILDPFVLSWSKDLHRVF